MNGNHQCAIFLLYFVSVDSWRTFSQTKGDIFMLADLSVC